MNAVVRIGQPEDFVGLGERAAETILEAFGYPELTVPQLAENQRIVAMTQQSCLAAAEHPNCEVFIATVSGCLAGFGSDDNETEPHSETDAFIGFRKFQRCGVAHNLMVTALEWLGKNGVQLGFIHYNARALTFYKKHDFEDTGRLIEGHEIPRKLMVKRVR